MERYPPSLAAATEHPQTWLQDIQLLHCEFICYSSDYNSKSDTDMQENMYSEL